MGWWGKLIGGAFGYMLGGPLGAVLGAALGHNFDAGLSGMGGNGEFAPGDRERVQTAFFTATFSVMGHLSKVDGRVSRREIALAEALMEQMDLGPELRKTAIRLFREGKDPDYPLDQVLEQFRRECSRRQSLIWMFLEIQLQAAYADGPLVASEQRLLLHVCRVLGVPEGVFRLLEQRMRAQAHYAGGVGGEEPERQVPSLTDAYAMLNLTPAASDAEVKRAYRRLRSQHHPDKLVAKGLPEEMMKLAARKSHEIRQAYERIREARGF